MKANLNEQLNRMKYLLHAERGQVLSESQIVKTYLYEQQEYANLVDYEFKPIKSGGLPIRGIKVDLEGKKMFLAETGQEVGFESTDDLQKNIGSEKFRAGMGYINKFFDEYGISKYIQNQGCKYYGFVFASPEEGGMPIIAGVGKTGSITCKGSKGVKAASLTTITTTIPQPPLPKIYILDLKDLFHYDCPNMKDCGQDGGSNEEPLKDMTKVKVVKGLGEFLASIQNWPAIKNTNFYIVGFASSENKERSDFVSHNKTLSLNRAKYIANILNSSIKGSGGNISATPIGAGPTEEFGENLADNRRIILTNNPQSFTPIKIKITVDSITKKIIDVEILE